MLSVPTAACSLVDRRTTDFVLGSLWVRLIGICLGYSNGTTEILLQRYDETEVLPAHSQHPSFWYSRPKKTLLVEVDE